MITKNKNIVTKKPKFFLGIDIGGTNSKYGIIDNDNNIIHKTTIPTNPNQTTEETLNIISNFIDEATNNYNIASIGIALPCVVKDNKITMAPNLPNWKDIDFGNYIKSKYSIPFAIDNDANAAAIAELTEGNGKNLNNFVYITLGTGVGGAIILNKTIYKGNSGAAGEIGHMIVDVRYEKNDVPSYRKGVLESIIGREAIINRYFYLKSKLNEKIITLKIHKNNFKTQINNLKTQINNLKTQKINLKTQKIETKIQKIETKIQKIDAKIQKIETETQKIETEIKNNELDVENINLKAMENDTEAKQTLIMTARFLGKAVTTINNILDIEHFIIGGGIAQSDFIIKYAEKTAQAYSLPGVSTPIILKAKYLQDTGIIGAALLGKIYGKTY